MPLASLTSPELAVGEQIQIQVVSGDGTVFLTVIGGAAAGGGTVTNVTGTAPIVVTPGGAGNAVYNVALAAGFSGGDIVFGDIAELEAFNVATPTALDNPGAQAFVQSNGSFWTLTTSTVGAVDHITIASVTGGPPNAKWVRAPDSAYAVLWQQQAAWEIDPQAGNDESSGNVGSPVKTWAEIVRRWGTATPTLAQNTVFHWLTSDVALTDLVIFTPIIKGGVQVSLHGTRTVVATTTLVGAGFQAKNRATGAQLKANLTAAGAAGQLVVNVTHPSRAWAYAAAGGNVFVMAQPLLGTQLSSTEVDTWASTDTVQLITVTTINLAVVAPTFTEVNQDLDNLVQVFDLIAGDPEGVGFDPISVGTYVVMDDVRLERFLQLRSVGQSGYAAAWTNVGADGSITGATAAVPSALLNFNGGYVNAANYTELAAIGVNFDGDVIVDVTGINPPSASINASICGFVNVVGNTLRFDGACRITSVQYGGGAFWGTSPLDVGRTGNLNVVGTNVSRFLQSGAMHIGGQTTASSRTTGGVVVIHDGITITPTALDAAAGAAGFGGVAFQLSGGVIQNVSTA